MSISPSYRESSRHSLEWLHAFVSCCISATKSLTHLPVMDSCSFINNSSMCVSVCTCKYTSGVRLKVPVPGACAYLSAMLPREGPAHSTRGLIFPTQPDRLSFAIRTGGRVHQGFCSSISHQVCNVSESLVMSLDLSLLGFWCFWFVGAPFSLRKWTPSLTLPIFSKLYLLLSLWCVTRYFDFSIVKYIDFVTYILCDVERTTYSVYKFYFSSTLRISLFYPYIFDLSIYIS